MVGSITFYSHESQERCSAVTRRVLNSHIDFTIFTCTRCWREQNKLMMIETCIFCFVLGDISRFVCVASVINDRMQFSHSVTPIDCNSQWQRTATAAHICAIWYFYCSFFFGWKREKCFMRLQACARARKVHNNSDECHNFGTLFNAAARRAHR